MGVDCVVVLDTKRLVDSWIYTHARALYLRDRDIQHSHSLISSVVKVVSDHSSRLLGPIKTPKNPR
jgi:hypothetical protein